MTRIFEVAFNPEVYTDIQNAVDFYHKQTGTIELGMRFLENLDNAFKRLERSALHYQIRYKNIRLLPIPSFPFRAHYWIDEEQDKVYVEALFHTREDPTEWLERT